jgi:hypothetical protein
VQDGKCGEYLLHARDWTVKFVEKCLFSHSPNPWACKKLEGSLFFNSPLRSEVDCVSRRRADFIVQQGYGVIVEGKGDTPNYLNYIGDLLRAKIRESALKEREGLMEMKKIYRASKCPNICFNREEPGCTNSETSDGQMLLCNCKGIVRKALQFGFTFDEVFYREHSIDLAAAGMGVQHFVDSGCKEFRCHRFVHATRPPLTLNCVAHFGRTKTPATLNDEISASAAAGRSCEYESCCLLWSFSLRTAFLLAWACLLQGRFCR